MIYAGLGYWGFGMSLSLLFAFKLGFEGTGIWIGLASGLAAVAILMMSRWIRRERLGLVPVKEMRRREPDPETNGLLPRKRAIQSSE